jgi:hypothetical protein
MMGVSAVVRVGSISVADSGILKKRYTLSGEPFVENNG